MESHCTPEVEALIRQGWAKATSIVSHLDGLRDATPNPDPEKAPYDKYIPINQQRIKRIRKTLAKVGLREDLNLALSGLAAGTKMLVLNEFWCGDGAQILPVHEVMEAATGGRLEVRVLMRDAHLDVMDLFLTNGGRSIPKTVLLNADLEVLGSWGPRPAEAMALVKRIKSDPTIAHTYSEEAHKWYTQDKQQNIQAELAVLLGHAQRA
ncbi:thioredoxin family protein [Flavobacteriales bacterium]|nr:thioredoxin family protein [Flavobacteriales bacterium]